MTRAEAYWILHEMMVETFSADQSKALSIALHDIQFVDLIPSDTIPVVRCKDCKWYGKNENNWEDEDEMFCKYWTDWLPTYPDDFCSYGERKEAEGDG